jgi:erythromycin esterase-like protein
MERDIAARVRALARPLAEPSDLDPLMELVGDARYVLLGEATHGTSQFYDWRAEISRRLIREKGFSFVAVEGDWPDCMRVNRYVRGLAHPAATAREVLHAYERWPTWMWANEETVDLVEWLRQDGRAGFYGLDVYSLWESLGEILRYVHEQDPDGLPAAIRAFECFDRAAGAGGDGHTYGLRARLVREHCEDEVVRLLVDLRKRHPAGIEPRDHFDAEQNALVAWNAERYYRAMVLGGPESWNIRDRHMMETLDRLMAHHGPDAKAIVWAHNTHVGDARATDMASEGMINLGQLVREQHPKETVLVGFGTYEGTVTAGRRWGGPIETMRVPQGMRGSWEEALHHALDGEDGLLITKGVEDSALLHWRGHRAIGVVYDPRRERGNYVPSSLPRRYDAFLFVDRTDALRPLHEVHAVLDDEPPETWPTGM